MQQVGYIYSSLDESYIKKQLDEIKEYGIKKIIVEEEDVDNLNSGDTLVIYELRSLDKTVTQLSEFALKLRNNGVKLEIINKSSRFDSLTDEQFWEFITNLSKLERNILSERTSKGIKKAKRNGKVGGRPKISNEKIEEIKYLYNNESLSLKEIAKKCGVSLGSAYKYIQD